VKFLSSHHLTPSQYQNLQPFDQDYVAACCYTHSLAQGNTIHSRVVSTQCIKQYLKAARIQKSPNSLTNSDELTYPPLIQNVLAEHNRWKTVPNKREPITMNMFNHWYELSRHEHPDSFQSATFDWYCIGMLAGFRKSEWLQDSYEYTKSNDFKRNVDNSVIAFIASDFTFSTTPSHLLKPHERIFPQLHITRRFQKNNQNGQTITFTHNITNPKFSPVLAAQRILARAKRLQIPHNHPIAVFANKNKIQYIHHSMIDKSIRACASTVYNITCKKKLQLYSTHSIRVGACVLLHSVQPDPLYIQFRLRWRSTSFIQYLRNTPKLASLHNSILNSVNTDDIL